MRNHDPDFNFSRRSLLKKLVGLSVLTAFPSYALPDAANIAVDDALLEPAVTSHGLLSPNTVGLLSDSEWEHIVDFIRWMTRDLPDVKRVNQYLLGLKHDLIFKTSQEPSYLTEYMMLSRLKKSGSWQQILTRNVNKQSIFFHVRSKVIDEIILHAIPRLFSPIYGLVNVSGVPGGSPLNEASYLRFKEKG